MGIYSNYLKESIEPENILESISIEDIVEFVQIGEKIDFIDKINISESEEVLGEGANLDIREAYTKCHKIYKEQAKICKKSIKNKDFKAAKQATSKMRTALKDSKKIIKEAESDVGSVIFGLFAGSLLNMVELLVPILGYTAGIGGLTLSGLKGMADIGAGTINQSTIMTALGSSLMIGVNAVVLLIKGIIILYREIKQFMADLNNKESTANTFNLYRNNIITYCDKIEKCIDKLDKCIDEREKKEK